MKEPGFSGDSLPEGVAPELTVSELEEMACRQQQQIDSQRQLLAAKEQRLRFLKQNEAKHQQVAAEHERLRRLRDRVELQEQKLRKLRALRGQVDQTKLNNVSLTSDLDSIRALFNEKEKELSVAVAKVDELTRQLEELQKGRANSAAISSQTAPSIELEKLRAELLYRNKLNEQQSQRLSHQREVLAKRQEEMAAIDRKISELQERLHRKRLSNQQLASNTNKQQHHNAFQQSAQQPSQSIYYQQNLLSKKQSKIQLHRNSAAPLIKTSVRAVTSGNVAAIEPYHHVPSISSHTDHQDNKIQYRKNEPIDRVPHVDQRRLPTYLVNHNHNAHINSNNNNNYNLINSGSNNNNNNNSNNKESKLKHSEERLQSHNQEHIDNVNDKKQLCSRLSMPIKDTDRASEKSLPEFFPSKYDSKYQTLPYGTKFNISTGINRTGYKSTVDGTDSSQDNIEGVIENANSNNSNKQNTCSNGFLEDNSDSNNNSDNISLISSNTNNSENDKFDKKNSNEDSNISAYNLSANSSNAGIQQAQQSSVQAMNIAHSIPIYSSSTKCLATPLSKSALGTVNNATSKFHESLTSASSTGPQPMGVVSSNTATSSSTNVTFTNIHQKPVSSVSPIYQTSSIRIQPVQPQILGSFITKSNSDTRNSYVTHHRTDSNQSNHENQTPKPALPPKPAAPVKATPPPPPRQSAFHAQYKSQNDQNKHLDQKRSCNNHNDNNRGYLMDVESHLSGLQIKDTNQQEKYTKSSDVVDSSAVINVNSRNSIPNLKESQILRKFDSPPPLPNVEPPSDDEVDKHIKMRTIVVQTRNISEKKNQNYISTYNSKNRIISDPNQDYSSSDTSSSTENCYFPNNSRRIELPPAYLFPENEKTSEKLLSRLGNDQESSDDAGDHNIILNMKSVTNQNEHSENEKESPTSSSPDSDGVEKMNSLSKEPESSDDSIKRIKKGNLKHSNGNSNKRRVSFDPLALLLDASLEGELELVIRTASQVKNPSAANDEGITALHNAICAGHVDIVRFLVQFGCDVNAQDSDGWTPLHCAASCNNLAMVRFLVEHGACIFATTLSDQETAAEKCEEDEEGFDGCSEFLYSVQEKLGILNNGIVYAVFDYEAHNPDELSFREGDRLTVLRKGDEWEREWWWSRLNDKEGYVPRNLLGLYPRIHPNKNQDLINE